MNQIRMNETSFELHTAAQNSIDTTATEKNFILKVDGSGSYANQKLFDNKKSFRHFLYTFCFSIRCYSFPGIPIFNWELKANL